MNADIVDSLRSIILDIDKKCDDPKVVQESYRLLAQFNKYLEEEQISPIDLESYLLFIFNKDHGIMKFMYKVNGKSFQKSIKEILEILSVLVNNFPSKMQKYTTQIYDVCLMILRSLNASSDERVKAISLAILSLEKVTLNIQYIECYDNFYKGMNNCLELKVGDMVQEKIYECLGLYAKNLDFALNIRQQKILQNLFFIKLKEEMLKKDHSKRVVHGLFKGLTYLSEKLPFDPIKDAKEIKDLYDILKKLAQIAVNVRIKTSCRAALIFLKKNMALFSVRVFEDHSFWHDILVRWIETMGADDKKVASEVILTVYQCISDHLSRNENAKHEQTLKKYLMKFRKGLDKEDSSSLEKRVYIHGIKLLFQAAPKLLPPNQISNFSVKLLHVFRNIYLVEEASSDNIPLLPDYVQMICGIITVKDIKRHELILLKQSLILMVKCYPTMPILNKHNVSHAFISVLYSLESNKSFDSFLSDVIYQSVIWSCSHHHVSELEHSNEGQKMVTVRDFFPFWRSLLNISFNDRFTEIKMDLDIRKQLLIQLIQKLIVTLFICVNKLDVTMSIKDCDSNDIRDIFDINEKNDFAIFLNIVDFYEELLPRIDPFMLSKCIFKILNFSIEKSTAYPMVSGFYKLLATSINIAQKIDYFGNPDNEKVSGAREESFQALTRYIQRVISHINQFKDELLVSCLKVFLQCPPSLIQELLPSCIPAFIIIFSIGRNYLPVAKTGIETLDIWQKNMPAPVMEEFLKAVVPILDTFLRSKSLAYSSQDFEKSNKTKKAICKRKVMVEIEPELVELQRTILRFIGRQTTPVCENLISGHREAVSVWGHENHLKIILPFQDVKLNIYLDVLVPKVVDLALYCSDRKMRFMACELLQALAILFLGISKQMSDKERQELESLLRKFSYAVLELGSDPDDIVRQLFEPLFLQMVHWYSRPYSIKCHSTVIIDTLMDGVSSSTNSSLRTFSGKCIGEFFKWTIKQSSEEDLLRNPGNIEVFIEKMRFFSTHPDNFKKLGAALIFNNFYVYLREERGLFNMFWIEIFQIFIFSLHFVDNEELTMQTFDALKHLQRGFVEKSDVFNKPNRLRRKPVGFQGTELINIMEYLLQNMISKNTICREKCMELFCNIIPFVSEARSVVQYFEKFIKDPLIWLKDNFESTLHNLTFVENSDVNCASLLEWMSELERCLDGMVFVLKNGILVGKNLDNTPTVKALEYYLVHIASFDMKTALNSMREQEWVFTHFEKTRYLKQQNVINNKIFNFCHYSLRHNCECSLWNANLFTLITNVVFDFNKCRNQKEKEEFTRLVKSLVDELPKEKTTELAGFLKNYLEDNFSENFDFNSYVNSTQKRCIQGLLFLQKTSLNNVINFNTVYPNIIRNFLEECTTGKYFDFDGTDVEYYSSILEFGMTNEFEYFVDFLYLSHEVKRVKRLPFGLFLLNTFETTINNILQNFSTFLKLAISKCDMEKTVLYIKKILSYLQNTKRALIQPHYEIFNELLNYWEPFNDYFGKNYENFSDGLEMINLINYLKKTDFATNWLISLIIHANSIGIMKKSMEFKIGVFEIFFESFDPSNQNSDYSLIRNGLIEMLDDIETITDKNTQSICLMQINKLFQIIQKSKTSLLLEFVLKAYVKFPETREFIKDHNIFHYFMLNLQEKEQLESMEIVINIIQNSCYSLERRSQLAKSVLVVVFQSASLDVFEKFYESRIKCLLKTLNEKISEHNIELKNMYFILVELLFARLPVGEDTEINERLTVAAFGEKRPVKDLIRSFLKHALNTFRDIVVLPSEKEELLRLYRCHSYNALVSIATNALNDSTFHAKLFTRLEKNEDILWKSIVDCKKTYKFEKDFTILPEKKKILVNIRNKVKMQSNETNYTSQSIRSQRIFKSSLSEDITKYDMSNVTLRVEASESKDTKDLTEIVLDYIDVNNHECMATVCALINHLAVTNTIITDEDVEEIPECFRGLHSVLLSGTTSVNVKIFLVKVIENTSHIFIHYSRWFLGPVMKFIVDKCAGDEINFFVIDLIVMLANWSEKAVPESVYDKELATKLIQFLFDKLTIERRDMFKFNLQLIKVIFEAWKTVISVPQDFHQRLTDLELEKEVEIHLISILLINNLFVFENGNEIIVLSFLMNQLNSSGKAVYIPCSECLGLFLKKMKGIENLDIVEQGLRRISEDNFEKGGLILEGITIHCPAFIKEHHVIRILSRLQCVGVSSQHAFLKVVLRAVNVLQYVSEFKMEDWAKYINSENTDIQIITLNLMKETLDIFESSSSFENLIKTISKKTTSQNDLCKKLAFDILIKICEENIKDSSKFCKVIEICKESLVEGLTVEDPDLLRDIRNFWTNSNILSKSLCERFLQTFALFYKPSNENVILGSGIYFLINLLEESEEFKDNLFDYPLENCNFEDYELTMNPTFQHTFEIPMFSESFLDTNRKYPKRLNFGEIRATQDEFSFAPTVPSRQEQALLQCLSSQSTLSFNTQNDDTVAFKNPNEFQLSQCKVLKRRFLRDKTKISEHCANSEVKSKVQKVKKRVVQAKERDRKVCISRKYRKGDFPDIQIPLSSIMVPLQMLAAENSEIAKLLYLAIFESLRHKLDDNYWSRMTEIVLKIFKNSTQFNTNFYRILLDFIFISESKIVLDPYLITDCCLSSSLISNGTLILEEYLRNFDEIPQTKKNNKLSEESVYWIKLAELYKEMDEWDVACSIFQEKVACDDSIKNAITSESRKLWTRAQDVYGRLIEKDLSVHNRDFYYEAYFRCFANLGQWEELGNAIRSLETQDWDSLWDDDWKQKKLLPWYITSQVNDMLFKDKPSVEFLDNINKCLCNANKAEYLKLNFSEHLSMMWILNEDIDTSEVYLKSCFDSFLSRWQILDPMFYNIRLARILRLRIFTDICDFIDIYRKIGSIDMVKIFETLRVMWSKTYNESCNSIVMHENRVLFHKKLVGLLHSKLSSFNDPDLKCFIDELGEVKFMLDSNLIEAALKENNYYMARKYCVSHRKRSGMEHYLAKLMFVKSQYEINPAKSLEQMLKSLEILKKDVLKKQEMGSSKFFLSIHMTSFEILQKSSALLANNSTLIEQYKDFITRIIDEPPSTSQHLSDYGANRIIEFLDKYHVSQIEDLDPKNIAEAYVKLAYYISGKDKIDVDNYNRFVLRAMKMGSKEARQLFPCLLQEEALGSVYRDVFVDECNSVPTWMFLGWIPQLLANLNTEKMYAIDDIIIRISQMYPQAIMYPYRLSRERFTIENEHLSKLIDRLDNLLLYEDVEIFLKALGNVSVPSSTLKHHLVRLLRYCCSENYEEAQRLHNYIVELFEQDHNSRDPNCLQGNAFKTIGSYGKTLKKLKCDKKEEAIKIIQPILQGLTIEKHNSLNLKDYSPWLASFSSSKININLEIPGQYDGQKMPLPQYHVKIHKFHPDVRVMSSLRKPIRITILGDDTKEYSYLVKFGEDIRQDQRVEQLFVLMNEMLQKNSDYLRYMSLETFEVIPLTSSLGIIKWVDNTLPFQSFMRNSISDHNVAKAFPRGPELKYYTFIKSGARHAKTDKDFYGKCALNYDRNKIISFYRSLVNEFDMTILRKAFWNISTNMESFIALRHNFMRSYATMCVAHWLLGIGDRHLDNTLVSLENGRVIGIDFGHAFGTATQFLGVPELVPFRLTPQIVSFMEPLKEKGHFRESMIHAMKSLRKSKELLLATMSVFIKEPSLDWLEKTKSDASSSSDERTDWFPLQKINQAKRKLEGVSSTAIMIEDLKGGPYKEYIDAYCRLVQGVAEFDLRARMGTDELTVEEQIDSLIDHAGDYNLLGRMYCGWNPWV